MTSPIGNRIRELREKRGLKQAQVAAYAKVTRDWLSLVETGDIESPGGDKLERIAGQLGVTSHYLLMGSDVPKDDETQNTLSRMRRFAPRILDLLDRIGDTLSEDGPPGDYSADETKQDSDGK